jgi:cytochrome b involved in lipid metabolism
MDIDVVVKPKGNKNLIVLVLVFLTLVLAIVFAFFYIKRLNNGVNQNDRGVVEITVPEKPYTLTEVSQHSTKEDCWMVIEGVVYDVTKFIPDHKGGDQILMGCGKDATDIFNLSPDGSGPHPQRASAVLPRYQVGVLSGS